MLVRKKADKPRGPKYHLLVIDYKEMAKITITGEPPIPNIATLMEQLHCARCFTIMDMESGLHQVRVMSAGQNRCRGRTRPKLILGAAPTAARSDVRHARGNCIRRRRPRQRPWARAYRRAGTEPREPKGMRQTIIHTGQPRGPCIYQA
ncbi:hypothetical protein Efla_001387 [Eimeria flavescens]